MPGRTPGWGAQIVEHPVTGIVIFADLDLAPEEATRRLRPCRLARLAAAGDGRIVGGASRRVDP